MRAFKERKDIYVVYFTFLDYLVDGRRNSYKIDFTRFKIRDIDTGTVLFEIAKPDDENIDEEIDYDETDPDSPKCPRFSSDASTEFGETSVCNDHINSRESPDIAFPPETQMSQSCFQ